MIHCNYKLVSGFFDAETGISTVTIQFENGEKHTGIARLHPDDQNVASNYYGCHLAEYRAIKSWAKKYKKEYTILLKAYKDIYNHYSSLDKKDKKRLENKIIEYEHEILFLQNVINGVNLTEKIARTKISPGQNK